METDQRPRVGDVIAGKYRIERCIGRGRMGTVFAATNILLSAEVALKFLVVDKSSKTWTEAVGRFLREARVMFAMKSEHAARVLDVATLDSGEPYIVMELLDGEDLEQVLDAEAGSIDVPAATSWVIQACRAIAEAHALGIVHRDIKPSNLFLVRRSDGSRTVKVLDFGVSKVPASYDEGIGVDSTRGMMGTPRYMAPEQFDAPSKADARSDIWALGAVLYRLLTGRHAYDAPTAFSLHARIMREDPVAPDAIDPKIPHALSEVVLRCLRRDLEARFPSAAALGAALEPFASAPVGPLEATAPVVDGTAGHVSSVDTTLGKSGSLFSVRRALMVGGAGVVMLGIFVVRPALRDAHRTTTAPPEAADARAPAARFALTNARRITFAEGCDEFPSFAQAGDAVLYDTSLGMRSSIAMIDLRSGSTRSITTRVDGWDYAARASPDGRSIAFLRSTGSETSVYLADTREVAPPRPFARGNARPTWSRDGLSIWSGDRAHLVRYDAVTAAPLETITAPTGFQAVRAMELAGGSLAVVFPPFDGAAGGGVGVYDANRRLAWKHRGEIGVEIAAMPDSRHLLATQKRVTGGYELVDVDATGAEVDGGEPLAAPAVSLDQGHDVSPDGGKLVWSTCGGKDRLARVDAQGRWTAYRAEGEWEERDLAWIPGTNRVAIISTRGGLNQPWILDDDERIPPARVSIDGPEPTAIAVSPDGRTLALEMAPAGIQLVSVADGRAHTLVHGATEGWPSFRSTGTELVFTHTEAGGRSEVRVVPIGGGSARTLVEAPARRGVASPVDDRVVYLAGDDAQKLVPMMFDPATKKQVPISSSLPPARYGPLALSPDGKRMAIVRGGKSVVEVDLASGAILRTIGSDDQLTRLTYMRGELIVVRRQWRGNLWMANLAL